MPKQEGFPQEEPKNNTEMLASLVNKSREVQKKAGEQKMEEQIAEQREEIIAGLIKHQIESNPNTITDVEQAKKYWGRFYDEANQGTKMQMQSNEIYAKRYEEGLKDMRDELLILEQKLNLAETKKEKDDIMWEIKTKREDIADHEGEIHARRGYEKPKKKEVK